MRLTIHKMGLIRKAYLFSFFLLVGCAPVTQRGVSGTYVSFYCANSLDTLRLFRAGNYEHLIYRTKDNSFVYKNIGAWKYSEGNVEFVDFVPNKDREYNPDMKYSWSDYFMYYSVPIRSSISGTRIAIDGKHYYIKIKTDFVE